MENWSSPFYFSTPYENASAAAAVKSEEGADRRLFCDACGSNEFDGGDDGFYYCRQCGSQSQDLVHTDVADEDILGDGHGGGAVYSLFRHRARSQPQSQAQAAPPISKDELIRSLTQSLAGGSASAKEEAAREEEEEKQRPYRFEDDEPSEPRDFGTGILPDAEMLTSGIRLRYVQGMQVMLQLQCEALVEKFGVSPLICGLAGTIWLRYVATSKVFDEGWGQKMIAESEAAAVAQSQVHEEEEDFYKHIKARYRWEPHNVHGRRAIFIWFRALRKAIPVYSSLAISFLVCHIAREAILPTDIYNWASEGKLPYLAAFVDIDKYLGSTSSSCPLTSRFLFRPVRIIGAWHLEAAAGSVAQTIGLFLPSVNFYAIAQRYLKDLSLPAGMILPHACRVYEWSIPSELWLSSNASRLPTRVCVMAILIVTIRILYNINGHGIWEKNLCDLDSSTLANCSVHLNPGFLNLSPQGKHAELNGNAREYSATQGSSAAKLTIPRTELNTKELLCNLEAVYEKICPNHDYSSDLRSFLKYCKDIIFAGISTSYDEETLIERLREVYDKKEDDKLQGGVKDEFLALKNGNCREGVPTTTFFDFKKPGDESRNNQHRKRKISSNDNFTGTSYCFASAADLPDNKLQPYSPSMIVSGNTALDEMKLNMEESGFQYLPPRFQRRTDNYLHYKRRKVDGELIYVAHADYYILLRVCAKLAQVDIRIMHLGVLKLERRLAWIEQRIDSSLNTLSKVSCQRTGNSNLEAG